jgi:glycosyltransferase involved in cell wall biosynthesis
VIHNGVGSAFLRCAEEVSDSPLNVAGLEPGGFLLHVGGLTAKKNAHTLLAMWERGGWWRDGYKLVLVGNHHAPYDRLASTLPGVTLVKDISDAQLARLYRQSAALVLPSWYEGFGIPVVEGMACAAPMVLSDIPAFREVAGNYAHFAAPGDTKRFVSIVDYLLSGHSGGSDLARVGRKVAARYTWDTCAARIIECLSDISPCH